MPPGIRGKAIHPWGASTPRLCSGLPRGSPKGSTPRPRRTCPSRRLGAALLLLASLAGCGYQLQGPSSLAPDIGAIHLAALRNSTVRPGLQTALAAALDRRLRSGGMRLADEAAADLVVAGTIREYANDGIAFERFDVGRRFRLRITFELEMRKRKGGRALQETFAGEAYYTAGGNVIATRAAEDEAAARAIGDLAEQIATRAAFGF